MREPSAHWQQLVARLRKGSAMNYVWPIALAALVVAFCIAWEQVKQWRRVAGGGER